jgi:hypothetical protein
MSRKVREDISMCFAKIREKSPKVAEGEMPSKNKIVDGRVIESPKRFEKVAERKKNFDWVEEWMLAENIW